MNKKGFTLIELLAVIIILGILMIIAIPSVTKYISDSRKSAYVDTAKEIVSGTRNKVNEGKLGMYGTDTTYYIPASYIKTENALKSPYGEFTEAYVGVIYDGKGYKYYWISVDDAGQGVKEVTPYDELDIEDIESDIDKIELKQKVDTTGIGGREIVKVLENGEWVTKTENAQNNVPEEGGSGKVTSVSNKICKRATSLHSATCNQTDTYGCKGNPSTSTTITYGNENTTIGTLVSGDAFDCDVNADGVYDAATERFYYVSNYFDVNADTPSFDNTKATLIYYTNVTGGTTASQTNYPYATQTSATDLGYTCTQSFGCNNYGPLIAYKQLPTKTQWNNNQIITPEIRQITNENGTKTTSGGAIASFAYNDKAARLITYQEVQQACGNSITSVGDLDNCNYLMENLGYEGSSGTYGYWLETPRLLSPYSVWNLSGYSRVIDGYYEASYNDGVRPAITILKSNILY